MCLFYYQDESHICTTLLHILKDHLYGCFQCVFVRIASLTSLSGYWPAVVKFLCLLLLNSFLTLHLKSSHKKVLDDIKDFMLSWKERKATALAWIWRVKIDILDSAIIDETVSKLEHNVTRSTDISVIVMIQAVHLAGLFSNSSRLKFVVVGILSSAGCFLQ